jgi:NAD(P)-dependent dehydrogenase (short-subunit alcohol dehydrogenase family)
MGRVIAAKLAADGFDVAVAYTGDVDLADATVGEIKDLGRRGESLDARRIAAALGVRSRVGVCVCPVA